VFRNFINFFCKEEADLEKVLMGWMKRIMINTAIDELRKQNLLPEIGSLPETVWEKTDGSNNADQIVLYKELISQVKKLPPSYRIVFLICMLLMGLHIRKLLTN